MKKIAIITLTYNKLEEATKPFLESLYKFTDEENFDLILVENGSKDGTREYLEEFKNTKSNVTLIVNDENLGYSKGNNQGLREVLNKDYDYIGLLNNDILFTPNWLFDTLKIFDLNPEIGMISPRIQKKCNFNSKNYLEHYKKYLSKFKGDYKQVLEPLFCCVLIKKEVFDKIGLFDENFTPAFFEDNDLSFRAMYQGYLLVYSNSTFVFHNHSTTSGSLPSQIFEKNKDYFFKKHPLARWCFNHRRTNLIKDIKRYIRESFE